MIQTRLSFAVRLAVIAAWTGLAFISCADEKIWHVKAISSAGRVCDIRGIKMTKEREETNVNGVSVAAHIKALPPAPEVLK